VTIRWESAGDTHTGKVRKGNEDSYRIDESSGVFVVADGMGGHAAGEVASSIAADAALRTLNSARSRASDDLTGSIYAAFSEAQRQIVECCNGDPRTRGMGTTLTVACLGSSGSLHVGHVGDSRLYRLHRGVLMQLTHDHTWVQQEIEAGRLLPAAARNHPFAHMLTRVLSADERCSPDFIEAEVEPGDVLLLCSDGLYNHLGDGPLSALLAADVAIDEVVGQLIRAANHAGGRDNITAVLVRIVG